jgi:hypothetical protein
MHNKISTFSICLLTVLTAIVPLLSGCNQASPTTTPSTKPNPVTTPKTPVTPTFDPNAPPAAYKLTNLSAEKVPDGGANEYWVFIDVENVGGQPGNFTATYRIDNGEATKDSKVISLTPGQKKQVELIKLEWDVSQLGAAYDSKVIEEKQHVVFCGELMVPITLAERPALSLLQLTDNMDSNSGNITVSGDVKNVGNTTFESVIAVVDIRITDQKIIWIYKSLESPVDSLPLSPGETASFTIVTPDTIPKNLNYDGYRVTFKDGAGKTIRAVSGVPQT